MKIRKRSRGAVLLAAVVVTAASGCSTKAEDTATPATGDGGDSGDVRTGTGVEGNTITLGVLTDLTGVFAALGKDITNANTLFWKDQKVCDTYDVKLDVKDTGYVPQQGVQLYSGMKDNVLAMQQTIGSPINAALAEQYASDQIVNLPSAWSASLTQIPGTGVVGATYQVEIANGYDHLFEEGLLKEGDTVGHIYFEGEYGANGLEGSKAVAKERDLKLIEAKIKPTDQDMTAQITQFKAAGVKAIVLTVAPGQTASAAGVAQAQGLDVPILGNNPVFAPGLLAGPAAAKLKEDLYVASPISSFDRHPELLEEYKAAYAGGTPSLGVVFGFGMGEVMKSILDQACEDGDLTREGVLSTFNDLEEVNTADLVVPIDGFELGKSPSKQSFILRPADVPGGAKVVKEAFAGALADELAG
jgi:ABC-type branched-subunit amino acid transport system substrate-binding protein